ncbi:MAG: molybdopterin-dependent oxidoreductase, partial [Actinomycetes bacterium]
MGEHGPTEGPLTAEELQLAVRNHGMPLEALRYDLTPTGLHYLLVHFDIPELDAATWRLEVSGNVARATTLSLEQLRARAAHTLPVTMECAGNGRARLEPRPVSQPWLVEAVGTATWTGTPLRDVLLEAGIGPDTVEIVFTGADHGTQGKVEHDYERSLPLDVAMRPEVLLAYEMNDHPLEPQHGAPLRLLVPGWYGMTSVKWLTRITAVTERFAGYQQAIAYRYQRDEDDPGEGVSRIRVRALMAPPGHPDFMTRRRVVEPGVVEVRGRAWSGAGEVVRVQFGVDGT